ncbi:MAG TPA: PQQ-binding-like beta-propeller repeat protein [Pirellulales bacterium]|nr:PQQ-binding-like beta-propeller repeat protein [Pirellulales bacterium]
MIARLARFALLVSAAAVAPGAFAIADDNWPQFRGPGARGVADHPDLPDTWSATENVAWKTAIAGRGWSSPIVWGKRVFLTSVTSAEDQAERKRGLYFGGDQKVAPSVPHKWYVYCLDRTDGRLLWERVAHEGVPPQSVHLKNTYASETPVTDGERVYAYFGNLGVFCYDFDGQPLWSRTLGSYKTADGMGTGSSPIMYGENVLVLNDNEDESFLLALDRKTGAENWRVARPEKSCWSTPYLWHNALRSELVISGSGVVRSYDLDGRLLWHLGDMSAHSIPSPLAGPNLLYLASGHVLSSKRPIVAVRPGGAGDISLAADASNNDFVAWCLRRAAPYNPSLLYFQDRVYALTDLGILSCYDAQTGKAVYERKRLPNGRAFTASPWAANGNIFCLSEFGDTFVIKAGDDFEVLRVNSLGDEEMFLSTPGLAGSQLLVRGEHHLFAIQKPGAAGRDKP